MKKGNRSNQSKKKSLDEMTSHVASIFKRYEATGTKPWTYEIAAKDLAYQVGSLTKLIMQKDGERFAKGKTEKELLKDISDELSDILAEVLFIAHELNIDMHEAWEAMAQSDENKISSRSKGKK
jgi:NTP pyrophosphatase (non-canonical NTP hydrolase)